MPKKACEQVENLLIPSGSFQRMMQAILLDTLLDVNSGENPDKAHSTSAQH